MGWAVDGDGGKLNLKERNRQPLKDSLPGDNQTSNEGSVVQAEELVNARGDNLLSDPVARDDSRKRPAPNEMNRVGTTRPY